ncbi:TPA: hypothetical protein ACPFIV_001870 [Klebsiella michiganensis]
MTSKLTRERLEEIRDYDTCVTLDESAELARMALAVMDSEPVAVVEPSDYVTAAQLVGEGPARKAVHELYEGALRIGDKLYRHAQQPVVQCVPLGDSPYDVPYSMPSNLRELIAEEIGILFSDDDAQSVWDVCRRAAMLQAGNSPVIPEGYVMVPKEPTAEMIAAAMNCDDVEFNSDETFCVNFDNIYAAMVEAAPQEVPDGK